MKYLTRIAAGALALAPVLASAQARPESPIIVLEPAQVFDGDSLRTGWTVAVQQEGERGSVAVRGEAVQQFAVG